ncbi:MAG: cysteinyl-tRNA synthetase [Candidatus Promineifilaceae bacterium]|jgi:cysteinyl-tRNA synthetase
MTLRITNVLTRKKEEFKPIHEGKVNMYVCGPTVYDWSHIGHAKTYVAFDVVVRYLRYLGYDVLYVQNITDVGHLLGDAEDGEDRIQKKARADSVTPMQIVETYTKGYFDNMDALGLLRPDISPRASGHVPEQIEMVQKLIDLENAYESNGSVYFDVTSDPNYGQLSGRKLEDQEEGVRFEVHSDKRHPADFALWKKAEPEHLLKWNSPWGVGFPGWHIECSAMAKKYLGANFDIHGGGRDNIFPHNECEIAQSECANGETFANYWMLTGTLTLEGVKMSKSLGNTMTINDALYKRKWQPEAVRMFVLTSHYTSPIDFSEDAIEATTKGWQRIISAVNLVRTQLAQAPAGDASAEVQALVEKAKADFEEKMNDDFNSPAGLAILQDFTRAVNTLLNGTESLSAGSLTAIETIYNTLGGDILGIIPSGSMTSAGGADKMDGVMQLVIELRALARQNKDWGTADKIRDGLNALEIALEDRPDGTIWKG